MALMASSRSPGLSHLMPMPQPFDGYVEKHIIMDKELG